MPSLSKTIDPTGQKELISVSVRAGRLKYFYDNWKSITNDKFVLRCISGYKIPFKVNLKEIKNSKSVHFSDSNNFQEIQNCVNKLLQKGAIIKCCDSDGQFLSSYFLVKKPDGSNRFILNLKNLNKFVVNEHFKIEDLRMAIQLIFPDNFLGSIDLEDAYYLIPIHESCRKFLRFRFNNVLYEFVCLPFGLSCAPFVFTKTMKVIVRYLRSLGYSSIIYLDDILCIEDSFEKCKDNINVTVQLLEYLGFLINNKKSCLTPSKQCQFLGVIIDTERYAIVLPDEKKIRIYKIIDQFLKLNTCTIREFARLIGTLVSICPAMEYAWLYTKILEKEKIFQLVLNNKNYDKTMVISQSVRGELVWFKTNIMNSIHFIKDGYFEKTIYTDASKTGWGAYDGSRKIYGFWSLDEKKRHINYLELLTVEIALKNLASHLQNAKILLRIDNTTALSYVNKMGGVRFDLYSKLARKIWQWAESRNIILIASYIPSKQNVIADQLSRIKNTDTEWELNNSYFCRIIRNFGEPQIDLFASALNAKCKRYVSWTPDENASFIDAFTIQWSEYYFYAFPPFSLILNTLAKIKREKAYGIIVLPYWKNQPWFPLFEKLAVGAPLFFDANKELLISPCRLQTHPRANHLSLIASRVSGKLS